MSNADIKNTENQWNEIAAFLNGEMSDEERLKFREKLRKNPELREMVSFSIAVDLREGTLVPTNIHGIIDQSAVRNETTFMENLDAIATHRKMFLTIQAANDDFFDRVAPSNTAAERAVSEALKNFFSHFFKGLTFKIVLGAVMLLLLGGAIYYYSANAQPDPEITSIAPYEYSIGKGDHGAGQYYKDGHYEQAAVHFKFLIDSLQSEGIDQVEINPYKFYLGVSQFKQGALEEAQKTFLALSENTADPILKHPEYLYLGLLYFHDGDKQEAKAWLEKAKKSGHFLNDGTSYKEIAEKYLSKIDSLGMQ